MPLGPASEAGEGAVLALALAAIFARIAQAGSTLSSVLVSWSFRSMRRNLRGARLWRAAVLFWRAQTRLA